MRLSVYDGRSGEIVKIVTANSLRSALENIGLHQEISEDETPDGLDDLSVKVDPKTGLHRAKTDREISEGIARQAVASTKMWEKEMADREAHRQRVINAGVSKAVADAIMVGIYGREGREDDGEAA